MASEFYVAEDGSIHRYPVTVADSAGDCANTHVPIPSSVQRQAEIEHRPIHQVSEARIACFWIVSIIVSILIAVGVTQGFGSEIYGSEGDFASTIGPFVVFAGALTGSILYGIFFAESVDYNLWAYILSAVSSVGGIIIVGIAVSIISFIVMIMFYILIIGFGIAIICGTIGGS